jgi:hypothetical protein
MGIIPGKIYFIFAWLSFFAKQSYGAAAAAGARAASF